MWATIVRTDVPTSQSTIGQSVNAFDSMCVNSDFVSNDIDESELQYEKQYEQRI
jgi:hypothetical protein